MATGTIAAIVVGTGFGCRVHVPALRAAGFEVVALVGRDPDRLARKAAEQGIPASFTDLDAAIDAASGAGDAASGGANATLVTVATTPDTHAALSQRAIARGCHVLCEKPFALDAAEGERLVEAAERAGVVHMLSHEFRWLPERAMFGRAIAGGLIGEPRFLALDQFIPFCADPAARLPHWWFDPTAGGGWLGAGGSHLIDQIRCWLGDFHSISASLLTVSDRQGGAEDSYSMRFRLKNGVEGSMQQSAGAWGPPASLTRCAGSTGTVWIDAGKVFVADRDGTRELAIDDDLRLPPAPAVTDAKGVSRPAAFETGPFIRLCEAMKAAIEGAPVPGAIPPPRFQDGLATMRVMDAMRASSASGGALQTL
ncbi:Gfo/Idh/MocA family oxidoreductase [Sphingobium sufflavum]|uniref:Gfo/Idh/MocA family protein n=1 Tax=Sphingobium sufflavum TaxID=1129547 RepID=UPI001F282FBC|nr:Gfo/Idh/MocA family oxidoreductase [Sphingobium sufflavum]MCE7796240.1 Gfo/Idh/MocA family oxidoreductase [Sphingobium sufflavum]